MGLKMAHFAVNIVVKSIMKFLFEQKNLILRPLDIFFSWGETNLKTEMVQPFIQQGSVFNPVNSIHVVLPKPVTLYQISP